MRWLVEVSSIGKTETQKVVVDAESWQRALQAARAQRGEEGPMSGFSIELLEEGYRAVDPVARVRFVVKRAPDDMPITAAADGKAAAAAPTSAKRPAAPTAARADDKDTKKEGKKGEAIKPPPVGSAVLGLPPTKLLASREQEPTEAQPLAYREYAFAVPDGTSEEVCEKVLRAQLEIVSAHLALANSKMGKLVNLAVFDVEFKGKPPRPPVATLAWKDWKGEPVVSFPRRAATSKPPASMPSPTSAPASVAKPASIPPPAKPASIPQPAAKPASVPPPAPPVPVPVPVPVQAAPAAAPPPPQPAFPPPAPPVVAAKPASVPPPPPPQVVPAAPPAPVIAEGEHKKPSHPPAGMVKTPSGRFVRGRVSGDELITSLFEAMHDLHFLRDALDGGQFCLALATEVLPSRAALIHFFDVEKRDWITACVRGKDTHKLLTARTPENDEMLIAAARKRRAVVVASAEGKTADRYQKLGGARSIIVAPVMQAGRALGALEILNPLDGMPFTEDEGNAMTYIAEQYAEYLGSRGIVTDRERIHSAAAAH